MGQRREVMRAHGTGDGPETRVAVRHAAAFSSSKKSALPRLRIMFFGAMPLIRAIVAFVRNI